MAFAQRSDPAGVMEELSGFTTLIDRTVLARLELDAVLTERFGPMSSPPVEYGVLGFGSMWTLGIVGGLRYRNNNDDDMTSVIRWERDSSTT